MKIPFFLTPKVQAAWVSTASTVRQAIEKMVVPVVDDRGVFIGIVRRRAILTFLHEKMAGLLLAG